MTDTGAGASAEATDSTALSGERADLLETLRGRRGFLLQTLRDLDDEQARRRTTVSELNLAGLVKHLATVEWRWGLFITEGAEGMQRSRPDWASQFQLLGDETLEWALDRYKTIAAQTDELVRTQDLDLSHELPKAPWYEPGARWTVRRVILHIISEIAQHAGHADIIRESLDGAKTMG